VTGGGRGIGRRIALGLAEDGADVAVGYRKDADAAAAAVDEIGKLGRRAVAYPGSVDSLDDDRRMVEAVVADFGGIDILVNNAGLASRGQSVAATEPAEMERVVRSHAFGAHHLCQAALPSMRTRGRGDIVFISSVITREYPANSAPYAMGKAAAEALAFTLAKEERAHGIRVNVVAPGLVDTDMGRRLVKATMGVEEIHSLDAGAPFGRVCSPDDVAAVVRFLVSDGGAYLTGQRIYVDGGGFTSLSESMGRPQ
jgi:NAD(P)-dependent dehydrogenase (short-subunit alcohol dehydrogenase family)